VEVAVRSVRLVGRHGLTATLYNADCLDVLPLEADAVISDPPYGMNWTGGVCCGPNGETPGAKSKRVKIHGDDEPFDPSPWLEYPRVVLFGSNHYSQRLPVGSLLVWLKKNDAAFGSFLSDAEVAWMKGGHGVYAKRDVSMNGAGANFPQLHPTQKSVVIMAWCLEMAKVPIGATVLDPYMGSGTTGIACIRTGRNFIGIERDAAHYATAVERIRQELDGALL
jgi:site-specific DNA-methyltransferase (adenine-specific)